MVNLLVRGLVVFDKLFLSVFRLGEGTEFKKIESGSANVNPGAIAATSRGTATFALAGAAVGDTVCLTPPAGLHDDLLFVGARVTGANTVTVYLYNPTGASIDDASLAWDYLWFSKN